VIVIGAWMIGLAISVSIGNAKADASWCDRVARSLPGVASTGGALALTGISAAQGTTATTLAFIGLGAWAALVPRVESARSAKIALAVIGGVSAVALITAGGWSSGGHSHLSEWLGTSPLTESHRLTETQALIGLGGLAFLVWPSNQLVRLTLQAAEAGASPTVSKIKGGRIIGPIERLLITILALLGEATPAALIASAKGLLRYPELKGMGADDGEGSDVHAATEYLLIGSVTSWLIAIAIAALLAVA